MRAFISIFLVVHLIGCAVGRVSGQEPETILENPLRGAIDFHVHSGPDSFTRSMTDLEVARLARDRGMRALVLKNHFTMTADRAWLAERLTGMQCYGGIVLNRSVGGVNLEAVRRMVTFTGNRGRVVWLPTFDAENHVQRFQEDRPFVPVVEEGQPVAAVRNLFKLIAQHQLVLETGHSSASECLILIRAARAAGVEKILVTHAMADPVTMSIEQMRQAAALGAKLECVWLTNLQGPRSHLASMRHWKHVPTQVYADAIAEVGAEHFVLASDLGQYLNPVHTDGLKAFVIGLRKAGIGQGQIDRMVKQNPAELLGLSKARGVVASENAGRQPADAPGASSRGR
ncbi:MAG: DUF6282 family protein [Planctomycetota bacterium]|nr:DUF6282 family protein [Planctomycetota bacterium]